MANGTLTIMYRNSNSLKNQSQRVAGEHEDALENTRKYIDKLDNVKEYSSRGYLQKASSFLRKRGELCDRKRSAANRFATQVESFIDNAENVDRLVADHIEDTYEQFKKITGINNGGLWGAIVNFFKDVFKSGLALLMLMNPVTATIAAIMLAVIAVEEIKKWYENLPDEVKYWIKAAISYVAAVVAVVTAVSAVAALIAGTIAAGPILLAITGVIAAVGAVFTLMQDTAVLKLYYDGDEAGAKKLSDMTTGQVFGECMESLGLGSAETWALGYDIVMFVSNVVNVSTKFSMSFAKYRPWMSSTGQTIKEVILHSLPFGKGQLSSGLSNFRNFKFMSFINKMTTDIEPMITAFDSCFKLFKSFKSIFVDRWSGEWMKDLNNLFTFSSFNVWDKFSNIFQTQKKFNSANA